MWKYERIQINKNQTLVSMDNFKIIQRDREVMVRINGNMEFNSGTSKTREIEAKPRVKS